MAIKYDKKRKGFKVQIYIKGETVYLGVFKTEAEAQDVLNKAELQKLSGIVTAADIKVLSR